MANDFQDSSQSADLRERAEAKLKLAAGKEGHEDINFSPWSAHLIHELQTHQIELEIQNETLRQTHLELVESHERFSNLYDFAPVGYLTLNQDSQIMEANLTVADMLEVDRGAIIGKWLRRFVVPDDQDRFYLDFQKKCKPGDRMKNDLRLLKADGSDFAARLFTSVIQKGEDVRRLVAITDAS